MLFSTTFRILPFLSALQYICYLIWDSSNAHSFVLTEKYCSLPLAFVGKGLSLIILTLLGTNKLVNSVQWHFRYIYRIYSNCKVKTVLLYRFYLFLKLEPNWNWWVTEKFACVFIFIFFYWVKILIQMKQIYIRKVFGIF